MGGKPLTPAERFFTLPENPWVPTHDPVAARSGSPCTSWVGDTRPAVDPLVLRAYSDRLPCPVAPRTSSVPVAPELW